MRKTSMPELIFHLESYTLCGEIQKEGKHSVISSKNLHWNIGQTEFIL